MVDLQLTPSTLKRPPAKLLARYEPRQAGDDTVETYLSKGFSLAICCRRCPRLVEWTPHDLAERLPLKLKIADLAKRLSCSGEDGCGSADVAVFPHAYEGSWRWAPYAADL